MTTGPVITSSRRRSAGASSISGSASREFVLAIDAGGTATRALVLDRSGSCVGFGQAGGGNPTSSGHESALRSVCAATAIALEGAGGDARLSRAAVAMAGAGRLPQEELLAALVPLGLQGPVTIEPDLLAMYFSGTIAPEGHVLVAGTGSVGARIAEGELGAVVDGLGWLVGDAGSGYWIGHQVVRTVAAALDGVAPATALTDLLLDALGLPRSSGLSRGRPQVLMGLVERVYSDRPVKLSRFAPLAFEARHDPAARAILAEAAALARSMRAVRPACSVAPVVLGGSVLAALLRTDLAGPLTSAMAGSEQIRVRDGIAGAAVLALLRAGAIVDRETFDRLREELAELRSAAGTEARGAVSR